MGEPDRSERPRGTGAETGLERPATRRDWEWLQKHPDAVRDLGYELDELDVIDIDDSDKVLFMPQEESMGESDTFVIIGRDDLVTPEP